MQGERYTDLSITLSTFLVKLVGLWAAKDFAEDRWIKLGLAYTTFVLGLCTWVQCRDVYFSRSNPNDVLYAISNLLTVLLTTFKVYVLLFHKSEFTNLVRYMREHFWNRKYDEQEKVFLVKCRKTCMFYTIWVICIGECAVVAFTVTPILANIGKNETDRIHPFNMYMTVLLITPYYEMFFAFEMLCITHIGICYFCFDNMFSILSMHLATQFRILRYRMEILCDTATEVEKSSEKLIPCNNVTESYEKFKNCVQQHLTLIDRYEVLEKVFSLTTLAQVIVFSVLICLFGYQILLAQSSIGRRTIYISLLVGSMGILFMFTYSCDNLMEESEKIGEAIYSTMWTQMPMSEYGRKLRKDLIMVMLRSRRICCMTAYGFFPVSIETFSTILSTAASYFTLLRNRVE